MAAYFKRFCLSGYGIRKSWRDGSNIMVGKPKKDNQIEEENKLCAYAR